MHCISAGLFRAFVVKGMPENVTSMQPASDAPVLLELSYFKTQLKPSFRIVITSSANVRRSEVSMEEDATKWDAAAHQVLHKII